MPMRPCAMRNSDTKRPSLQPLATSRSARHASTASCRRRWPTATTSRSDCATPNSPSTTYVTTTRRPLADVERLTQREADLTSRLTAVEAARDALDLQLAEATNAIADADAALRDAEQRHRAALSAAAGDLAERQARFDRELSQTVADRDHVSQRRGRS